MLKNLTLGTLTAAVLTLSAGVAWADAAPPKACTSMSHAGDACNDFDNSGVCIEIGGKLQCRTACTTQEGTPCCGTGLDGACCSTDQSMPGTSVCLSEAGGLYCVPPFSACKGKASGADCKLESGDSGTCTQATQCESGSADLYCDVSKSSGSGGGGTGGSSSTSTGSSKGSGGSNSGGSNSGGGESGSKSSSGCSARPVAGGGAAPWATVFGVLGAAFLAFRARRRNGR